MTLFSFFSLGLAGFELSDGVCVPLAPGSPGSPSCPRGPGWPFSATARPGSPLAPAPKETF